MNRLFQTLLYKLSSQRERASEREPGSHWLLKTHCKKETNTAKKTIPQCLTLLAYVTICFSFFVRFNEVQDSWRSWCFLLCVCVCVWPLFIMCRKLSSCVYWELLIFHCLHFLSQNVSPTCLQNLSIISSNCYIIQTCCTGSCRLLCVDLCFV